LTVVEFGSITVAGLIFRSAIKSRLLSEAALSKAAVRLWKARDSERRIGIGAIPRYIARRRFHHGLLKAAHSRLGEAANLEIALGRVRSRAGDVLTIAKSVSAVLSQTLSEPG
jgi:hypothetical protein